MRDSTNLFKSDPGNTHQVRGWMGACHACMRYSEGQRKGDEALDLLREVSRRIRDGSARISEALSRMYQHKEAGDVDRARQETWDVLPVEAVPFYREIAEGQLEDMADEP
ncbi:DUSAM domain-containing protein [Myxococcus sp. SDU36]|uniref:DUSAM domain-containing protein n=1 Tax=Myxococcus sp. SDU36 TaxID=2831967 RepID=UPI002542802E|nr:DUSAM domain-containing protein [Myxococcus sp. SDU36]WIG94597.1 DUSAM domain-containing protein [Myxococcus sp. SDU36]